MDPQLLDYYNQELAYMRELADEFAQSHPKVAARLGMRRDEIDDPYVERLIESFCFLTARTRIKLDAQFPRFTSQLLEALYPNYLAPTPSMGVVRLYPSASEGNLAGGFTLERDTAFLTDVADNGRTACQFRSSQPVTVWPLEISEARLSGMLHDLPDLARHVPQVARIRGALRLRLRSINATRLDEIATLERLPVYLMGDETLGSQLFELLHTASVGSVIYAPRQSGEASAIVHTVEGQTVVHEGFEPDQALLPLRAAGFHGHNLLHEFFACPGRFLFFTLTGLGPGIRQISSTECEIIVLLDRPIDELAARVDASNFALFCTPVINLFPRRTDRLETPHSQEEFHLVPARLAPLDYEIHSVRTVSAQRADGAGELEFRPLFETVARDGGDYGRYFSLRREPRLLSESARRGGPRTPYVGTETFVSLVDQYDAPYAEDIRYLCADALVTNRDLPLFVRRQGVGDLSTTCSAPVERIVFVHGPTAPLAPYAQGEASWRLIRQLDFNHLPLDQMDENGTGAGLREMLRLFQPGHDSRIERQIASLIAVSTRSVTRKLPGDGPLMFGRGIECCLTIDESGFSGGSPYLFGFVMERWLARHVSINCFTQTELHSEQRGLIARWPVRQGTRGVI
ncbi:type VI secretion system baseplate subunit TssF [Paraburkholderia caffeinilytica]|uniref:type VI secretion system baseplate subunit TssF n=1 Tax=Paraburkholderia caffeinilytica TaxID=1761016 RepID=UPI003DA09F01